MTKDEALRMVLDAMEDCQLSKTNAAIQACEKALAQPTPDPIAVVTGTHAGYFVVRPTDPAMVLPVNMALYIHSKKWQDLTDEERDECLGNYITAEGRARAIEAKLKQKNGYAEEKNT